MKNKTQWICRQLLVLIVGGSVGFYHGWAFGLLAWVHLKLLVDLEFDVSELLEVSQSTHSFLVPPPPMKVEVSNE